MDFSSLLNSLSRWGRGLALAGAALAPLTSRAQTTTPAVIHLEAEDATLKGVTKMTATAGFTGTGYVGNFANATDSLIFKFPATAGAYSLVVRYANGTTANSSTKVLVNGVLNNQVLATTGTGFGALPAGTFILAASANTVAIAGGKGPIGIDYIELTPAPVAPLTNGRAEAEAGVLSGVTAATTPTGFSGAGFVTGFDNSDARHVDIVLNNPTAGLYKMTIGYTSPYGPKVANVTVNNSKSTASLPQTMAGADFMAADAGTFLLPAGLSVVSIGGNYGYYGIDYIQLTATSVALPAKPAKQLSDPLATATAKALHGYLVDLYGTKILAGQQDDNYGRANSEVAYVLATTGKEPAIVSMDLYDYSAAPVAKYGTPSGTTERYLGWSRSGNGRGITALIWHWRAPADNVTTANPNGSPDGAFYTANTAFNFATALADTAGTKYHLLLKDIDLIAAQLKKFQAAGVPVLWRPLHETPGTFFWWGNQGPDNFKKLWQLLYTRLTVRHQLHNLVWVYSANAMPDAAWYPGDAYVDVAGDDIYQSSPTPDPNVNISGNWTAMRALAPTKLIALTETESLLNPAQVRGYATWWSWFCAWQGSYIRTQPVAFLTSLYNDNDIIAKDRLADWATQSPLAARSGAAATAAGLTAFPNPASGYTLNASLRLATAQAVTVELVNALGQRVVTLHPRLAAGDNQFQVPLAGVAPGVYQLVVRSDSQPALSQRVLITR